MLSNLHAQNILSPARIFVIFEDQKIYQHHMWNGVYNYCLNKNTLHDTQILGESRNTLSDKIQQLNQEKKIMLSEGNLTDSNNIDYVSECLTKCYLIIESLWTKERDFDSVIEISSLANLEKSEHPLKKPEMFNFDSSMPHLVFWCLDTDGLLLTEKELNQQGHISVKPLRDFLFSADKMETSYQNKVRYIQHSQKIHSKNNVYSQDVNSTDHFMILLHPNAEILEYCMSPSSKERLSSLSTQQDVYFKKVNGVQKRKHGTKVYIGVGLQTRNSKSVPNPEICEDSIQTVQTLFLENDVMAHSWNGDDVDEFLSLVKPIEITHEEYVGNVVSASLYLKKTPRFKKNRFPLNKMTLFSLFERFLETIEANQRSRYQNIWNEYRGQIKDSNQPFELMKRLFDVNFETFMPTRSPLNLFKWTSCIDEESASMVWSEPHRCNGKTMIPLHPDHVSEEILEKYGRDVYGGFKPCQRIVKNTLRCWDHD